MDYDFSRVPIKRCTLPSPFRRIWLLGGACSIGAAIAVVLEPLPVWSTTATLVFVAFVAGWSSLWSP
jgi:hypothetical protein